MLARNIERPLLPWGGPLYRARNGRLSPIAVLMHPHRRVHRHENQQSESTGVIGVPTSDSIGRRYFKDIAAEVSELGKPDLLGSRRSCRATVWCLPCRNTPGKNFSMRPRRSLP